MSSQGYSSIVSLGGISGQMPERPTSSLPAPDVRFTIKDKRMAQSGAGGGWNRHVDHDMAKHASSVLRRQSMEALKPFLGDIPTPGIDQTDTTDF